MNPHSRSENLLGIALIVLSASMFSVVDAFSKLVAETQSIGQVVFARYIFALIILFATTRPKQLRTLFHTRRPVFQIVRAFGPICVSFAMVLAVHHLPLAEATVILFAAPFLVVIMAGPILGERVHPSSWIGVILGFAAVVMVARPGFSSLSQFLIYPLAAAVFYALYQITTRAITAKGEDPRTTLAWTLVIGGIVAIPIAVVTWQPVEAGTWLLMAGLGVSFYIAQWLMVTAYANATAGLLAPFAYAQVIAAAIIGYIVFAATPDAWTIAGVVLITASGAYVARAQAANRQPAGR